jgi:hypothetical protein
MTSAVEEFEEVSRGKTVNRLPAHIAAWRLQAKRATIDAVLPAARTMVTAYQAPPQSGIREFWGYVSLLGLEEGEENELALRALLESCTTDTTWGEGLRFLEGCVAGGPHAALIADVANARAKGDSARGFTRIAAAAGIEVPPESQSPGATRCRTRCPPSCST